MTRRGSSLRRRSLAVGAGSPLSSSTTSLMSSIVSCTFSIAPPRVNAKTWRIFVRMFWRCVGSSVAKLLHLARHDVTDAADHGRRRAP